MIIRRLEPDCKMPKSLTTSDSLSLAVLEGELVLPPPPSFKTVHLAPGVNSGEQEPPPIPTEGLPTRPAGEVASRSAGIAQHGTSNNRVIGSSVTPIKSTGSIVGISSSKTGTGSGTRTRESVGTSTRESGSTSMRSTNPQTSSSEQGKKVGNPEELDSKRFVGGRTGGDQKKQQQVMIGKSEV